MSRIKHIIQFLDEHYLSLGRIRRDVLTDKLQLKVSADASETGEEYWRDMSREEINSIVCQCALAYEMNISERDVKTVLESNNVPAVHPLREYILSLSPYTSDQIDWIDFVAKQVRVAPVGNEIENKEADKFWRHCFRKWFVAMVASWMIDDVVNHECLILIGKQGSFKTSWLASLIPPHLRKYSCFMGKIQDLDKDELMRISEFGLITLDEIDSLNQREVNQLKSLLTAPDVNVRAPYATHKVRKVRLASFCGSGNKREFLTDETGNRRWLVFEVESIQNPYYTTLPYAQMYAQAWALIKSGMFNYWFDQEENSEIEAHNLQFRDESSEEGLLPILFDIPCDGCGEFLTTAQISERLVTYGGIKKPMSVSRLGMILGDAGYKSARVRIGKRQVRGWIVYQRDSAEISSLRSIWKS